MNPSEAREIALQAALQLKAHDVEDLLKNASRILDFLRGEARFAHVGLGTGLPGEYVETITMRTPQ